MVLFFILSFPFAHKASASVLTQGLFLLASWPQISGDFFQRRNLKSQKKKKKNPTEMNDGGPAWSKGTIGISSSFFLVLWQPVPITHPSVLGKDLEQSVGGIATGISPVNTQNKRLRGRGWGIAGSKTEGEAGRGDETQV